MGESSRSQLIFSLVTESSIHSAANRHGAGSRTRLHHRLASHPRRSSSPSFSNKARRSPPHSHTLRTSCCPSRPAWLPIRLACRPSTGASCSMAPQPVAASCSRPSGCATAHEQVFACAKGGTRLGSLQQFRRPRSLWQHLPRNGSGQDHPSSGGRRKASAASRSTFRRRICSAGKRLQSLPPNHTRTSSIPSLCVLLLKLRRPSLVP